MRDGSSADFRRNSSIACSCTQESLHKWPKRQGRSASLHSSTTPHPSSVEAAQLHATLRVHEDIPGSLVSLTGVSNPCHVPVGTWRKPGDTASPATTPQQLQHWTTFTDFLILHTSSKLSLSSFLQYIVRLQGCPTPTTRCFGKVVRGLLSLLDKTHFAYTCKPAHDQTFVQW